MATYLFTASGGVPVGAVRRFMLFLPGAPMSEQALIKLVTDRGMGTKNVKYQFVCCDSVGQPALLYDIQSVQLDRANHLGGAPAGGLPQGQRGQGGPGRGPGARDERSNFQNLGDALGGASDQVYGNAEDGTWSDIIGGKDGVEVPRPNNG